MIYLYCFLLIFILTSSGCISLDEALRGVAGTSTRVLEEARANAVTMTFNRDYDACYQGAKKILKEIGAYTYAEDADEGMIAVYLSYENSTPVGIFFKKIGVAITQIQVSSQSADAKKFIAEKVFSALEKSSPAVE